MQPWTIGNRAWVCPYRGWVCLNCLMHRCSQRCVRCMLCWAYSLVAVPGVHSSSAMMMSAPMMRWMSTTFSGVNMCGDPSMCERNMQPSSVSLRMEVRENTWNPPLSVRMGSACLANRCRPPAALSVSHPGRR